MDFQPIPVISKNGVELEVGSVVMIEYENSVANGEIGEVIGISNTGSGFVFCTVRVDFGIVGCNPRILLGCGKMKENKHLGDFIDGF